MRLKLKPATADLVVRDPQTGERLPVEGKSVEINSYWRRRLRDQDVVKVKPSNKPNTKKKDT